MLFDVGAGHRVFVVLLVDEDVLLVGIDVALLRDADDVADYVLFYLFDYLCSVQGFAVAGQSAKIIIFRKVPKKVYFCKRNDDI